MKKKEKNLDHDNRKSTIKMDDLPGYPLYPVGEDIYRQGIEEQDIDPEDISRKKVKNQEPDAMNEKDFKQDQSGGDLDVPGSELDDKEEKVGGEDEENNYYSLGGDNHTDLEENKGS